MDNLMARLSVIGGIGRLAALVEGVEREGANPETYGPPATTNPALGLSDSVKDAFEATSSAVRDALKHALESIPAEPSDPQVPWAIVGAVILVVAIAVVAVVVMRARRSARPEREQGHAPQRSHTRQGDVAKTQTLPRLEGTEGASEDEAPRGSDGTDQSGEGPGVEEAQAPEVALRVGKLHGQGTRKEQQDSFGVTDEALVPTHGMLAVVCDGMGGLENGAETSVEAVRAVMGAFAMSPAGADPLVVLTNVVAEANQAVNRLLGPYGITRSGSTLVAALIHDGKLSFASVGDSRICLYRAGELIHLNREHVYERELALRAVNGEMTLQEAWNDSQGARLSSYLGMGKLAALDLPMFPVSLLRHDLVILMTDGVYNAVSKDEMCEALSSGDSERAAERLHAMIRDKGFAQQDNYTAVIVSYNPAQGGEED